MALTTKFIKVLKQQKTREGSLAETKWKVICRYDGKTVDALTMAFEKAKIPASRRGLSWHIRKEYVEVYEADASGELAAADKKTIAAAGEDAPAKCKPAKPCVPAVQKFDNLVGQ